MKKYILTILTILIALLSQGKDSKNQFVGVNLLQLPTSTINMNYSTEYKPRITSVVDFGFALGYNEKYDLIGRVLTPHIKLNDGYLIKKQLGGYFKYGGYYNFRKGYYKRNFFHIGLFMTSSVVYENGYFLAPDDLKLHSYEDKVSHTVLLLGINSSIGYEFEVNRRLRTNIDFQFSVPSPNYSDLYSYSNFIPGMGFKDIEEMWFPMLIFNIKYKLDTEKHLRE